MDIRWDIIKEYAPFFLEGTLLTIGISLAGILVGVLLGLVISLGRMVPNKLLRFPFVAYINCFRGTPVLVQLFIVHYALLPSIYPDGTAVTSAIVTLSLNSSAYVAEIFRAGIQSLDNGQTEAARSLGMNKTQTMRYVILPQAVRRMIPPLGNEFITLIKESSLASVIAAKELMYWGDAAMGQYYVVWEPYITIAIIYLVLVLGLSYVLQVVEKKWAYA